MDSPLDLGFNEDQEAIRAAVDRFCKQHTVEDAARQSGAPFPRDLWRQLAELGVFCPASPGHPEAGGALEVCAISETLGSNSFPGPLAATYLAIQVLEAEQAAAVIDGHALVSLSTAGSTLLPWGTQADLFLVADSASVSRARPPQQVSPVPTLGGETWGRASLQTTASLPRADQGLIIGNIASAAYLSGAAWRLLRDASEHAATRKQFGKPLGDFQAVTHPLADCAIGVTAARTLARAAANSFDHDGSGNSDLQQARRHAAGARVSAERASLKTAFVCHQVFAGIGITLEGPAFHISRRIRQVVSEPPATAREQGLLLADAGLGA